MKAIVLRGSGGPEVLRLEEVPTPTPAAGEILVKVRSVSVNRTLDLIVRQGNYPVKVQLPHILGVDPAGVVAHVGTDADTIKADVKPGEWVLVMGATGALGSCCVQVAQMLGAKVIAGAGADERVAAAKSYGADFGVNYRQQNLAEEIMRLTDGRGVDVACENIADPTLWPGVLNSLAIGGRLGTVGAHGGGEVKLDVKRLYMRRLRIIGAAGTNLPTTSVYTCQVGMLNTSRMSRRR